MRFRVGVHLGDVIEKADGTIYGDGVNIAARLEGLAEPGGITVSESVQTAVRTDGAVAGKLQASAAGSILALPDKPSIAVLPFHKPEHMQMLLDSLRKAGLGVRP